MQQTYSTQLLPTDALRPHPKNDYYFDEVTGEDYENLRNSIAADGVIEPIIVAPDMTILSGHFRHKAAKEVGLEEVPVIIRKNVKTEDDKRRILIAANFGRNKNSEAKRRRAISDYVELVGMDHGGDRRSRGQNDPLNQKLTLAQIAEQLGISEKDLKRTLAIERNLTDSMKELLDTGVIGKTLASECIATMSEEEQEELVKSLNATRKYTAREVQPYIDKIRKLEADASSVKGLEDALSQASQDADWYKKQLAEAQEKLDSVNTPLYKDTKGFADATADTRYLSSLMLKVQRLLDEDLSPLKFSKAMDTIHQSAVDKKNVNLLLEKVYLWYQEVYKVVNADDEVIAEII